MSFVPKKSPGESQTRNATESVRESSLVFPVFRYVFVLPILLFWGLAILEFSMVVLDSQKFGNGVLRCFQFWVSKNTQLSVET